MIGLTARQAAALRFITGYREAHGRTPSLKTIAAALGVVSHARAHYLVTALCERGAVVRGHRGQIEVIEALPIPRSPEGDPLYFVAVRT